jgi:hypothetical protein
MPPRKSPLKSALKAGATSLKAGLSGLIGQSATPADPQDVEPIKASPDEHELKQQEALLLKQLVASDATIAELESKQAAFQADFEKVQLPMAKEAADAASAAILAERQKRSPQETALSEVRRQLQAISARRHAQAAIDQIRDVARLRAEYERSARGVQELAEEFAARVQAHGAVGRQLMDRLGSLVPIGARRQFMWTDIDNRLRYGLFRLFTVNPNLTGEQSDPTKNRWLSWNVNAMAPSARLTFLELERAAIDGAIGFFATREEAELVLERISTDGVSRHIVRDDSAKVFRLVEYQLAGDYGATPPASVEEAEQIDPEGVTEDEDARLRDTATVVVTRNANDL